jgi:tight adherence protein C
MIWILTTLTFIVTLGVAMIAVYGFTAGKADIVARLGRVSGIAAPVEQSKFAEKQTAKVRETIADLGKILPPPSAKTASKENLLMIRAGIRDPQAILIIRGVKVLLPLVLASLVYSTGIYRSNPLLYFPGALLVGYVVPDFWLTWRVRRRQMRLRRALPDALDLLVICVEAGLGLDQAIMKVSQDLRITHRELSDEFQLVNLEMRVGKTRIEALHELARRTGLDDIKSLVAMLVQTERFGTSIAQSLRVYSDDMRVRRRQRAEEMSAKTSVKMVPVLVFFIFPALMVVILGPGVITIMKHFSSTGFHR